MLEHPLPMHALDEQLIGYLLDALDEPSRREVDAWLLASAEARTKLERMRAVLAPLEADHVHPEPPAGLVERTVAAALGPIATLPAAPKPPVNSATSRGWWRRADVLVASLLVLLSGAMLTAWIQRSRSQSDVADCQDNLRRVHRALTAYADQRQDGAFPRVEQQGSRSFAGVFIPVLVDSGTLKGDISLTCPSGGRRSADDDKDQLRTIETLYRNDRAAYERAVADLAGCYAYSLGFRTEDGVQGLRRGAGMDEVPIVGDCPPFSGRSNGHDGNSREHRGMGQNVLSVGGGVRFVTSRLVAGDDIYLNQDRYILAGVDEADYVLAAADASP